MLSIRVADTFFLRFRGLMGKKMMQTGEGLLIRPCRQVHMFFMRFPIDVVFLDRYYFVVGLQKNLQPWSISAYMRSASQALELPVGSIQTYGLHIGQSLEHIFF